MHSGALEQLLHQARTGEHSNIDRPATDKRAADICFNCLTDRTTDADHSAYNPAVADSAATNVNTTASYATTADTACSGYS